MEDFYNEVEVRRAISPLVITDNTAAVSQIIDLANCNKCLFVIETGTLSDADTVVTALLEEGDAANLSDAAAVADADMIGTEAAASPTFADDNETRKLGYIGSKRYVRLTMTPANNTGNIPLCAIALLSGERVQPVDQGT